MEVCGSLAIPVQNEQVGVEAPTPGLGRCGAKKGPTGGKDPLEAFEKQIGGKFVFHSGHEYGIWTSTYMQGSPGTG